MRIEVGDIIPGIGIGEYLLGMKKNSLLEKIGNDYSERRVGQDESVIIIENAKIWLTKEGIVRQIAVTEGFSGSYKKCVTIGTTMQTIKDYFGAYEYVDYTYNILGVDGMCFELKDIEEWNELTAPIEWIFVFIN